MPPKRRAPSKKSALPAKRPSKLAKDLGLTAEQEAEIREAFSLFAVRHEDYQDSKEGVLKKDDVRRCLISLNLAPSRAELPEILSIIDPEDSGFVPFKPFFEYTALAIHQKADNEDEDDGDEDDEDDQRGSNAEDIEDVYNLFTHGGPGPITLAHLRRVARELRDEVDDALLKDMIRYANGSVNSKGNPGGVGLEEFESVMRKAGVTFG